MCNLEDGFRRHRQLKTKTARTIAIISVETNNIHKLLNFVLEY